MKKSIFRKILSLALAVSIAMLPGLAMADAPAPPPPDSSTAASLTDITDEMSTVKISPAVSSHEIMFVTPSGVDIDDTIIITFQSDFAIGALAVADIDLAEGDTGVCSSASFTDRTVAASASADTWGVATTSSTITFSAPSSGTELVTAGRCMQIQLGTSAGASANVITNTTGAGSKTIAYTGTFGDVGTSTVQILTDDQVAVSAEVVQSISFNISSSTISFGNLDASDDRFANDSGGSSSEVLGHMLTAGTNASSGYSITVKGATLTNGGNIITAIGGTAASSTLGSEQFGMRISASGSGSGVVSSPYDLSTSYAYAADSGTTSEVATASGPTADTDYSVYYIANIASNTEAGTYTTALTYVATANF